MGQLLMNSIRLVAALALLAMTPAVFAQEPGTVTTVAIHSKALEGNLLGDPADQQFAVYTPPGYAAGSGRYPTVYLLHGIADSFTTWIEDFHVPEMLDRLITSKAIPPVIVVMPNARNRFLGSYYLNSPVTGRWSDYVADEVVRAVDTRFRTMPNRLSRAVLGHSMGGFGAIHFAMTRSDVFSVAYAMSPCCLDAVEDVAGGNVAAWTSAVAFHSYDDVTAALEKGDFYPVALVGFLSAASPDPAAPLHVRMPYRRERGELVRIHPAYDDWVEQFPVHAVPAHRNDLMRMRALAFDFGYDDQFAHIPPSTIAFSRALYDARIPHRLDVYDGDHRKKVEDRLEHVVLPFVVAALAK